MGVSLRTLARRTRAGAGLTPLAFTNRILERATHLLETTRKPVEEIARLVGYGDAAPRRRLRGRSLGSGSSCRPQSSRKGGALTHQDEREKCQGDRSLMAVQRRRAPTPDRSLRSHRLRSPR